MFTQSVPFGMYGLGQMGGWPQYPVPPQLLHGYHQDPYGLLARTAWQNPWQTAQVANPWVIQALIGELAGTIARQGHIGLGQQHGFGTLGVNPLAQQLLAQQAFGQIPFGQQQLFGQLPITAGLQPMIGNPWMTQGSYGNGIGTLGLSTMGAGVPFPSPVANWSMPVPAMV